MAIGILDGNSQQLTLQSSLVATGTSADVFTFQNPPTGLTWTGTLSVAPALVSLSTPATALFTATIGSSNWGEWGGNSVYGPVQCNSSQQLVVACSGLTPGVPYICTWVGSSDPSNKVQPIYPAANSTALTASIQAVPPGQIATFPAMASLSQTITVPAGTRTLIIQDLIGGALSATPILDVKGSQSLLTYYDAPFYLGAVGDSYTAIVPVNPAVDSSYIVQVYGGTETHTVTISGDTTQYDESVFYNDTINVTSTAAVGTTTLVTGPARLLTAQVEAAAAGVNSARLRIGTQIILTADSTAASSATTEAISFPPNVIVPAGATADAVIVGSGIVSATWAYP